MLLEYKGMQVKAEDFIQLVQARTTESQYAELMADEKSFTRMLSDYYVTAALAREAEIAGLDSSPDFLARADFEVKKLLADIYLDSNIFSEKTPDFDLAAKEYYLANKDDFIRDESVSVSHILIKDDKSETDALTRINLILERLRQGESFRELALEYSEDASVHRNKGALGFIARGQMVKPFEDAAFKLKRIGEVSSPVKSEFGFHLIMLEGIRESGEIEFDEVKESIIRDLVDKYQINIKKAEIERIKNNSDIFINEDAIRRLINSKKIDEQ